MIKLYSAFLSNTASKGFFEESELLLNAKTLLHSNTAVTKTVTLSNNENRFVLIVMLEKIRGLQIKNGQKY